MAPFFPKRLIEFLNKYLVIISASEIIHLVALHAIQLSYRYCSLDEMIVDHTVKTAGHWLNQANCSYRRYKYKCTWLTYYRKDFISSFCSFHRIKRKTVQLFGWFLHHGHTAVIEMYLTRFFYILISRWKWTQSINWQTYTQFKATWQSKNKFKWLSVLYRVCTHVNQFIRALHSIDVLSVGLCVCVCALSIFTHLYFQKEAPRNVDNEEKQNAEQKWEWENLMDHQQCNVYFQCTTN